ncbi:hypothetical protein [Heyndrickxia shackletonii]|nr:hypothetical protein [Heyndrickxia shackletonii]
MKKWTLILCIRQLYDYGDTTMLTSLTKKIKCSILKVGEAL